MTIEALVVSPRWIIRLGPISNRLHEAMPSKMIRFGHLAVKTRLEMGKLLRHFIELHWAIFLMVISGKLVTPGARGAEYSRRRRCVPHVGRLDHVERIRIQARDRIRITCRDRGRRAQRVVREKNPITCVETGAPCSMSQFGFFNPVTNLWSVDEGEVVQCATAATPVFNLQPTVF